VFKCVHGSAPPYLAEELGRPADSLARCKLRSASSSILAVRRIRLRQPEIRGLHCHEPHLSDSTQDPNHSIRLHRTRLLATIAHLRVATSWLHSIPSQHHHVMNDLIRLWPYRKLDSVQPNSHIHKASSEGMGNTRIVLLLYNSETDVVPLGKSWIQLWPHTISPTSSCAGLAAETAATWKEKYIQKSPANITFFQSHLWDSACHSCLRWPSIIYFSLASSFYFFSALQISSFL